MNRISIRFAQAHDTKRFENDGVVSGPLPAGETWTSRIAGWRAEQQSGRRAILVAEDASGLLGMVQIIFSFPPGYTDPEVANGRDIAMMESLRTRRDVPRPVIDKLVADAQTVAKRHHVTTLTLCLPLESDRAILQAKSWGFTEFRLMPAGANTIHAFFKKAIA